MSRLPPLLLALCCGCVSLQDRLASARDVRQIAQATADFYVQDGDDDACAVAVVSGAGAEPVFAFAGGANEHSLFRLASLSKLFLHSVLMRLHAAGRIDLDRPITAYSKLPLPPECARVTMRDLLHNRSGLPREFLSPWNPLDVWTAFRSGFTGSHIYAGFDCRADFARELSHARWRAALRRGGRIYSNVGFGLAGMVAEDALGRDLETLLAEELTRPQGYADTTYCPAGDQTNRLSRACAGHLPWLVRRHHDVPDHRLGDALRATGGLFSSVADCARFFASCWPLVDALLAEQPLATLANDDEIGLLRVCVLNDGRRVLYRAGMIYGGASFVGFDPATRTIVVILRNVTSWPDRRGFAVMESLVR